MTCFIVSSVNTVSMFCRLQMKKRKDISIRSSEMGVLIFVQTQKRRVTPVEISRYFNIRKPSGTTMVKSFLKNGYLSKYLQKTMGEVTHFIVHSGEKNSFIRPLMITTPSSHSSKKV